ncbi:MAG: GNAT family N-acetyltransferase [Candidatus Brockarchaeota archaeon]|nr:GNAT family N-acetyltransferase [Candidatus Brockarchaeota archaeon]
MASLNLAVRKARPEDVRSCLGVEESQGDDTFSEHDFLGSITEPNAIFLVAELDKSVVGFVLGFIVPTRKKEAILHSTMVHRQHCGKGVGSSLVRGFAERAFERGAELVYAEVEEGPDKFYEKCGFEKTSVWNSMVLRKGK